MCINLLFFPRPAQAACTDSIPSLRLNVSLWSEALFMRKRHLDLSTHLHIKICVPPAEWFQMKTFNQRTSRSKLQLEGGCPNGANCPSETRLVCLRLEMASGPPGSHGRCGNGCPSHILLPMPWLKQKSATRLTSTVLKRVFKGFPHQWHGAGRPRNGFGEWKKVVWKSRMLAGLHELAVRNGK